jgi:hypothetical protein
VQGINSACHPFRVWHRVAKILNRFSPFRVLPRIFQNPKPLVTTGGESPDADAVPKIQAATPMPWPGKEVNYAYASGHCFITERMKYCLNPEEEQ